MEPSARNFLSFGFLGGFRVGCVWDLEGIWSRDILRGCFANFFSYEVWVSPV